MRKLFVTLMTLWIAPALVFAVETTGSSTTQTPSSQVEQQAPPSQPKPAATQTASKSKPKPKTTTKKSTARPKTNPKHN